MDITDPSGIYQLLRLLSGSTYLINAGDVNHLFAQLCLACSMFGELMQVVC